MLTPDQTPQTVERILCTFFYSFEAARLTVRS
jgi:hypothetical protein